MLSPEDTLGMSAAKIAYVFPGQGSQKVGMGLDLYERFPAARRIFDEADRALEFPLSRLCFEGPEEDLNRTVHTQPAIFTVSLACLQATAEVNDSFREVSPSLGSTALW